MQSLQILWPVAATIGLSMHIIASAPSGQPSARSLWNSEMRSSSGHPASVTLNGDFLNGHVAFRRLLVRKAVRARVLALLVAPDAVVRLVESADQIRARVGQREAFALAQCMVRRQLPRRDAVAAQRPRAAPASCSPACAARETARRPCAPRGLPACAATTPHSARQVPDRRRARLRPAASASPPGANASSPRMPGHGCAQCALPAPLAAPRRRTSRLRRPCAHWPPCAGRTGA